MGAYATGSASTFADLLTAIETFLVANGYTGLAHASAGERIIHKGNIVTRWKANTRTLEMCPATGVSGNTVTGQLTSTYGVMMADPEPARITFPVTYYFHYETSPEEVVLVISYNGGMYQNIAFGLSDAAEIGGTGMWCCGTWDKNGQYTDAYSKLFAGVDINGFDVSNYSGPGGSFFLAMESSSNPGSYINHALDVTASWRGVASSGVGNLFGPKNLITGLLMASPSSYNDVQVLVPPLVLCRRNSSLSTLVLSMRHVRLTRIDNVDPGEVITYGTDKWKFYPLYAKNTVARNGVSWATGANHSGTFGFAVRYSGP